MDRRRALLFIPLLLLSIALAACSDSTLKTIATEMPIIATANQGMLNTVTAAVTAGAMTSQEAAPLVNINLQIALAGKQVDTAVAGLSSLTPAQKMTISAQVTPIATAITAEVANLQIGNATTKTAVLATLTTLQGAVAAITIALGK